MFRRLFNTEYLHFTHLVMVIHVLARASIFQPLYKNPKCSIIPQLLLQARSIRRIRWLSVYRRILTWAEQPEIKTLGHDLHAAAWETARPAAHLARKTSRSWNSRALAPPLQQRYTRAAVMERKRAREAFFEERAPIALYTRFPFLLTRLARASGTRVCMLHALACRRVNARRFWRWKFKKSSCDRPVMSPGSRSRCGYVVLFLLLQLARFNNRPYVRCARLRLDRPYSGHVSSSRSIGVCMVVFCGICFSEGRWNDDFIITCVLCARALKGWIRWTDYARAKIHR